MEMFDSFARPPSRRRRIFFAVSGGLHVAAIGALAVTAMWRVEKLTPDERHATIAVLPPPPGNSGGGQKMADAKKSPTTRKPPVRDPVQPVRPQHLTPEPIAMTPDLGGTGDGGGGDGGGVGTPTTGSGCTVEPCGIGDPPPVVITPRPCSERPTDADCVKVPQVTIDRVPEVALGHRISGDAQIHPPDIVGTMMKRDGKSQTRGTFKMCLDTDGNIASVSTLRTTGYDAYDERLTSGIRTWRYEPYRVNGQAHAVCTVVTFVYAVR
jgi:TonB family protein